jgi:hypothetical protein
MNNAGYFSFFTSKLILTSPRCRYFPFAITFQKKLPIFELIKQIVLLGGGI